MNLADGRPAPLPDRILVVDDDPFIRSVTQAVLETAGATVKVCASCEEALGVAVAFCPTLILLDFVMSGMDGRATWTALNARLIGAGVDLPPVIFVTARADVTADIAGLGAAGTLAKPFNPTMLAADICRILGGARASSDPAPARLAGVAADFHRSLPATSDIIEGLGSRLCQKGWQRETAEALLAKAHSLAGSAGLFNRHGLGDAAESAERLLLNALKLERLPEIYEVRKILEAVAALVGACRS